MLTSLYQSWKLALARRSMACEFRLEPVDVVYRLARMAGRYFEE